jgi:excisionase family DNA binding protein
MPEPQVSKKADFPLPDSNLRWLLVTEAALYLRVSPQTVRSLIHHGRLKAVRGIGQGYKIDRADLDNLFLREKKVIPPYRRGAKPWVAKRHAANRQKHGAIKRGAQAQRAS